MIRFVKGKGEDGVRKSERAKRRKIVREKERGVERQIDTWMRMEGR